MTASDTRETVAFAMWKHEALRAAPNVGKKRTPEAFADASDADRSKWLGLADAAIAAIPAMQVAVKPLEWVYDEMRGVWSAQDGFGRHYTVSDSQWFHGSLSKSICVDGGDEAAKAAAQADYEARIRSALTTSAATSGDGWALRIIQNRIDTIVQENGSWEPDTNVTNLPEWAETAIEELEAILSALARVKGGAA